MLRFRQLLCFVALLAAGAEVYAAEFVSVSDKAAVLYDGPSPKAHKLFVVSRYLPLEQVLEQDGWVKVRDSSGGLAWIEKRALSNKRYVAVTADIAAMRQAPEETAAMVAQVKQQVALEFLENTGSGWVKVRHADGETGYVKVVEVWGN